MIKYYLRTTGERKVDSSFNQIDYSLLLDKEKRISEIFGDQLLSVSDNNCVLLEDDIVLCRNFKERIESVISKYPDTIINFFSFPNELKGSEFSHIFAYNQCTYYPASMLKFLGQEISKNQHKKGYLETPEKAIKRVFKEYNLTYYKFKPYLVQHLDYNSEIGNDKVVFRRRSPFFIDYIDDLNINYEDIFQAKNQIRLNEYMWEWFKKRKKEGGLVN